MYQITTEMSHYHFPHIFNNTAKISETTLTEWKDTTLKYWLTVSYYTSFIFTIVNDKEEFMA
jgi:hypothetical protein